MNLDLRHLRYFVAVAEELSFTTAAVRLHMAQPPLSRTIRSIEEELGVKLFERTTRQVELTPAGRVLLEEARTILGGVDEAISKTRQAGRIDKHRIRIGFRPAASLPLLEPIVRSFRAHFPQIVVDPVRIEWSDQIECLLDGRADVAFVLEPVNHPDITVTPLLSAPRAVGMPRDHPLGNRSHVEIADLRFDAMAIPAGASPEWEQFWTASPRPIDPSVGPAPTVANADESLAVVLSGTALVIATSTVKTYYSETSLAIVPIIDIDPAVIGMAVAKSTTYNTVEEFRKAALETASLVAIDLAKETGTNVLGPESIEHARAATAAAE